MTGIWRPKLLIVEDEVATVALVEGMARAAGFEVVTYRPGCLTTSQLSAIAADAALFDIDRPDRSGRELMRMLREARPACEVVLIADTADGDAPVEAVKQLGALDYLTKPLDRERLAAVFTTIRKNGERRETLLQADGKVASQFEFYEMIGRGPAMQELFDDIRRFAPHLRRALIVGEPGTGKELVAHALHQLGTRSGRPLATINFSAGVETPFESKLFGHIRGAFNGAIGPTGGLFESADGGTVFLDEIGETPLPMQSKLLHAVEYGEVQRVGSLETCRVDVRVIAATNRDLREQSQSLLRDLYYRLSVVEFRVPPLRNRREDIPYLTAAFVRDAARRMKKNIVGVSAAAERILLDAEWPGNVREFKNVVERACVHSQHRLLTDRDVTTAMPRQAPVSHARSATSLMPRAANGRGDLLRTAKREQILQTLRDVGGNKAEAARQLGVGRRSLYRWLENMHRSAERPQG